MLGDNWSVPHSPASSITSLPASDDISDFSDSDFDIISSSDSTRSHEDDIRAAAAAVATATGQYSDDETDDHSIEPALLLDREWYGVIDPQRVRASPFPAPDNIRGDSAARIPLALSDEDASVINALSQSLERSNESIRASSTPVIASVANVHFITSPSSPKPRQASSVLSYSRQLDQEHDFPASPSSSVLQLAFPDPLSPSESSLSDLAIPSTPTAETLPVRLTEEELQTHPADASVTAEAINERLPDSVPELQNVTREETLEASIVASSTPEPDMERERKVPKPLISSEDENATGTEVQEAGVDATDEKAVLHPAHRAYHPFDAFDEYMGKVSKELLSIISGNRWTASVIVSILAILIGGVTYLGTPSVPSPTPSLLVPSSTSIWGLLYPVNKSSLPAQPSPSLSTHASAEPHTGELTPSGSLRDVSLSLFVPWAVAPSPMHGIETNPLSVTPTGPRGTKRKRDGNACKDSEPNINLAAVSARETTTDAPEPTLLIDAPSLGWSKSALSKAIDNGASGSKALADRILSLPEARILTNAIKEYVYPVANIAYSALSEDLAVLLCALDELLAAIQAQTIRVASVIGRARQQAAYRHARAKAGAHRLKKKGDEVVKGFKRTAAVAVAKGESFKADPKGVICDIASGVKKDVFEVAEGVREGFRQGFRIRKSRKGTFYYGSAASGSSGGDRSDIEKQNKKAMKQARKERERAKKQARKEERTQRKASRKDKRDECTTHEEGGFLNMKRWGLEGKNKGKLDSQPASTSGSRITRDRRKTPC